MHKDAKIYIAGHKGLVGSAIMRKLTEQGFNNLVFRTSGELDLTIQKDVEDFFAAEKPDYVFLAAARVGGIHANNSFPAEFIYSNLAIQSNIIHSAWRHGVKRLLFLGSSCIYPKLCTQPMKEDCLLSGALEQTNEPYAVAKIAGIKMCEAYNRQYQTSFLSVMPTNLYGPGDNFDLETSHVLPALLRKFHEAKLKKQSQVTIWGTGKPRREFLHVDDMADACVLIMGLADSVVRETFLNYPAPSFVNIGCGQDVAIADLARLVAEVVGFTGQIVYDSSKPDGTLRKLLDVSRLKALGWEAGIALSSGIKTTYSWYCDFLDSSRQDRKI